MEMNWIPIVEGCEMPDEGDEVLITIQSDASYGKGTNIEYYTDLGVYQKCGGYLDTPLPGDGFDTCNDWDEGQPIEVIAWMPKPIPYKPPVTISDEKWKEAINYLNMLIAEYASIGFAGSFGLNGVLIPLKKRFDKGERTKELYDEIMQCE